MDQKKTGAFFKKLRKEKNLTQEQLAEKLGVTNRTISRWENGVNMPDFDLVIEMADFYDVSIEELLNGERRKEEMIDKDTEEAMLLAAGYSSDKNRVFAKRIHILFILGIAAFVVYMVLEIKGLTDTGVYEKIAEFALGLDFGMLIAGAIYTSKYASQIRAFKQRILKRGNK